MYVCVLVLVLLHFLESPAFFDITDICWFSLKWWSEITIYVYIVILPLGKFLLDLARMAERWYFPWPSVAVLVLWTRWLFFSREELWLTFRTKLEWPLSTSQPEMGQQAFLCSANVHKSTTICDLPFSYLQAQEVCSETVGTWSRYQYPRQWRTHCCMHAECRYISYSMSMLY